MYQDTWNEAEHMCYQLEKEIEDNAEKLTDADREPLQKAIEKVREAAKAEDVPALKTTIEELEQARMAFSKTLYEKTGAADANAGDADEPPSENAGGNSDDDAIDAEFEVKDS